MACNDLVYHCMFSHIIMACNALLYHCMLGTSHLSLEYHFKQATHTRYIMKQEEAFTGILLQLQDFSISTTFSNCTSLHVKMTQIDRCTSALVSVFLFLSSPQDVSGGLKYHVSIALFSHAHVHTSFFFITSI